MFVSTSKPGRQPVLTATVFEAKARDQRCDRDLGVQQVAANAPAPPVAEPAPAEPAKIEVAQAPEPAKVEPAAKPAKKDGWLRRTLRLGGKD